MNVVLLEPEIAPNTGNVARLCAATGAGLHLIEPFGFRLGDRELKRAGMDYWRMVQWRTWPHWDAFCASVEPSAQLWLIESGGPRRHTDIQCQHGDYFVFGRESQGLPQALLEARRANWVRIPMLNPAARSLNLGNCVAIVLYEALRQQGFPQEG